MAERTTMTRSLLIGAIAAALPALANAAAAGGDATKGETLFKQRCGVCHTVVEDAAVHPGPLLKGIVGRKAATVPAFKYSKALQGSGLTWDRTNLDKFLAMPGTMVPGTFMVISVPNPTERQDVIAFLAKSSAAAPASKVAAKAK